MATTDSPVSQSALRERILADPILKAVLNYAPMFVGVLNHDRRFVVMQDDFFHAIGVTETGRWLGHRPGEVFGCIHHRDVPGGCGEGPACQLCGAVQTVVKAQRSGSRETGTSRLTTEANGRQIAWDLEVQAEPVDFHGTPLILLFMHDLSSETRRAIMERTFFHDVLNSMASLQSALSLQEDEGRILQDDFGRMVPRMARDVTEQISFYRRLSEAEKGELELDCTAFDGAEEVRDLVQWEQWIAENSSLGMTFELTGQPVTLLSDRTLFRRIILNMIRNAREASTAGQAIRVRTAEEGDQAIVAVHNESVMSRTVQLQVFQRSFSTKGRGRGTGTYSMKLLAREYLGGDVTFTSAEGDGTEFTLSLPLTPKEV